MDVKDLDLEDAVHYHYDQFPPKQMNYGNFVDSLIKATDAIARYDQMVSAQLTTSNNCPF